MIYNLSYSFRPKDYGVTYDEICRFRAANKSITHYSPGWFNPIVMVDETTTPYYFFRLFEDIGEIQASKNPETPKPFRIS